MLQHNVRMLSLDMVEMKETPSVGVVCGVVDDYETLYQLLVAVMNYSEWVIEIIQ